MEYIIGILLLIAFVGFRWYGGSDPVTLDKIRQIPGMRSIVSAVYDVKPGEVWPEESIKHLVDECREHGLIFDVVESIPVAEECGVVMALHPDDPPYPIFGLPRVITCEENLDRYLSIVDSPANSLCLCTGSLGSSPKNDIPAMVRKYSSMNRIGFMHIRNVKILPDTSFEESGHLTQNGSLDMNAIVKALVETGFDGYFRPDHGRMIWGETGKPGYGLYDRALGTAYINGLIEANGGVIE